MRILGTILVMIGFIWILRGIGVLPGSFMTGQIRWAVYGGVAVVVGLSILARSKSEANAPPALAKVTHADAA